MQPKRVGLTPLFLAALVGASAGASGASTGCGARRQSPCETVCVREERCARELERPAVDRVECQAACSQLEEALGTKAAVEEHAQCVAEAPDCAAVLACP